jgi:broad specificity phosphatase PhoE
MALSGNRRSIAGDRDALRAMTTVVYLVRHGSVVGAETRRFIGHLDVPLSTLGERQIAAVAARLSGIVLDAVYSSDLLRARRSAEILAAPHGLVPVERPALREFAMGRWEGLTGDEIKALDADAYAAWMADVAGYEFPDGENLQQLSARAWPAFEEIVAAHPGGTLAVVAHGGTNRALLCRALGIAPERILALGQDYAALSALAWSGGRFTLALLNHQELVISPPD